MRSVNKSTRSVLFVEDNEPLLHVYERFMSKHLPGCSIHAAADGRIAWEMMQESAFGVVVTDMSMPHIDGQQLFHLAQEKQALGQGYQMPRFIFCSAVQTALDNVASICAEHKCLTLEKPCSAKDLADAILSLIP